MEKVLERLNRILELELAAVVRYELIKPLKSIRYCWIW